MAGMRGRRHVIRLAPAVACGHRRLHAHAAPRAMLTLLSLGLQQLLLLLPELASLISLALQVGARRVELLRDFIQPLLTLLQLRGSVGALLRQLRLRLTALKVKGEQVSRGLGAQGKATRSEPDERARRAA